MTVTNLKKTKKVTKKNLIQLLHSSESNEWYTPLPFIDAGRELMGSIDLDPASCEEANLVVGANKIFTITDDGFAQEWFGNVFLNPPYGYFNGIRGVSSAGAWSNSLLERYNRGEINSGILVVNASVGDVWWTALMKKLPFCLVDKRTRFRSPMGVDKKDSPSKGNSVFYFGKDLEGFRRIFEEKFQIGTVFYEHISRHNN